MRKEIPFSLLYKERTTGTEFKVKRVTTADYLIEVGGVWVPIRYHALKKTHTFVRKVINYEFNHQKTPTTPGHRRNNAQRTQ